MVLNVSKEKVIIFLFVFTQLLFLTVRNLFFDSSFLYGLQCRTSTSFYKI